MGDPVPAFRLRDLLIVLLLIVGTAAALGRVCWNGFINYDDPAYLTRNAMVQVGLTAKSLHWAWTTAFFANWHPLTWMSLQLDAQVYGPRKWGYHLTSLLLHVANVVLLFWVLRRMTGATWRSALVAALFAVHPLHVEPVAWVAERKGVLSTFFGLLALWAYVRYVERPGVLRYLAILPVFALSLMSKPMLVTFPFVLLLLDVWPLGRLAKPRAVMFSKGGNGTLSECAGAPASIKRLLLEKLPLLAVTAVFCAVTVFVERQAGALKSLDTTSVGVRLNNAVFTYAAYLGKTLWPSGLSVFYPHPLDTLSGSQVVFAAVVLVGISALVLLGARKRPYLAVGWLWYLGTLVPVIGLVPFGMHGMADRYTYVPHIGLFLILAWGVPELLARWGWPPALQGAVFGSMLAACIACSWVQVGYWRDDETLWSHILEGNPRNYLAHNHLGVVLEQQDRLTKALDHYHAAVDLMPDYCEAQNNLGSFFLEHGNVAEAVKHFLRALDARPGDAASLTNLGKASESEGRLDDAISYFRASLKSNPGHANTHYNLGLVLAKRGHLQEAAQHFTAAARLNPKDAEAWNRLGIINQLNENSAKAAECFKRAVQLIPQEVRYRCNWASALCDQKETLQAGRDQYRITLEEDPRWPEINNRTAWDLATNPDQSKRDGRDAVRLAREACEATDEKNAGFLETLAAACAEAGDHETAKFRAKQARDLAAAAGDRQAVDRINRQLKSYEQGRALPLDLGKAEPTR